MSCFYWKDGVQYTQNELMNKFLAETEVLDPASIFSDEDVQTSSMNAIKKLHTTKSQLEDSGIEYKTIAELVTKPDRQLFSAVEIQYLERLAPEYIEVNRIKEHIIQNIQELGEVDPEANIEYNVETYMEIIKDPRILALDQTKVKHLQAQIEEEIELDKKTIIISSMFHNIITDVLNLTYNHDFDESFEKHFDADNTEVYGDKSEDNTEAWRLRVKELILGSNGIKEKVEKLGKPLTNLNLTTHEDSKIHVKGQIDLVAVDSAGDAHVFDIMASKRAFTNWDPSKRLTADWSLAVKRQMLGQSVSIDHSMLYIIPLNVQALRNPKMVSLEDFQQRSTASAGTGNSGKITSMAEKLIPRRLIVKYNPDRINHLKNMLSTIISKEYEIKTDAQKNDVDSIMEAAEKRFNSTKVWSEHNRYEDIEGIPKGWIEVTPKDLTPEEVAISKEEFRKKIIQYVEFVKQQENRGVIIIQDAIISALKTNQKVKTSDYSPEKDKQINHLLNAYLNEDWEVVRISEATAMGIVVLRNKYNNTINLFNLTAKQSYASTNLEGHLAGDLDIIKAMTFLNEFKKEIMPDSTFKLGQIMTFNTVSAENYYKTPQQALKLFTDRMNANGLNSEINLKLTDLLGIEDVSLHNVMSALQRYEGKDKDRIDRILNTLGDGHIDNIDKLKLIETRDALLREFPTYINHTIKPELDFGDSVEVILALLQVAILSKEGVDPTGDFQHLTKYSFQAADFTSLLKAVYTKDIKEYDKTGKRIQWLIGGLAWTNPEYVQSHDLRQINTLISTGNSFIGERMLKMNEITRGHTKKYYDALEYNTFERMSWGQSQSKHRNLFRTEANGDVSKDFATKNPYITDVDNALEDFEREYLKNLLLIINQYKYGVPDVDIAKVNVNDIESLKTINKFKEALESGEYFEIPLIRKEELSRFKGAFKSLGEEWQGLGMMKDTLTDLIDGRELSEEDVKNVDAQRMGFFKMYDIYDGQTNDVRAKMIQERGSGYFELNLDTIAHRVAFNKIRKQTFDLILPSINAYMWWIKLIGAQQNVDVSKQLEYVVNQIKLAIFDEPLINDEQKTIAKGLSLARQISTVAMLAFRPALLAKEMTIGVLKNFSASALGINEEFGAKEMSQAYEKLITVDSKFTDEFNMIDRLNHMYRMANMDISTVPKKMQTDRWGVSKGLGRYMFMTSTVGDYYNRMAVLLAKMIKEGSYEAHSMVDGGLVYDVKKDKRYSKYLSERDNYKNSKGEFMPKKGDEEFNRQRNRYLLTIEQLNKEGASTNQKKLTENDLIHKAFTQQERNSIKSYADLMYGAYDKDWQAQFPNMLAGIAFMQFLTFWPNKMRQYFGKPISDEDSIQGKIEQVVENIDGKEVKQWWETIEHEDGSFTREATSENTGDPILTWKGTPQEGLFVSVMYTAQDLVKGDWKKVKNNKLRRNRAMFAMADAALIALLLWIMQALYGNIKESVGRGSLTGETVNFMDSVNTKVLREFDVYDNTFGAINSEPLMLAWATRTMDGLNKVFTGDANLNQLLTRSVGAFEFLK